MPRPPNPNSKTMQLVLKAKPGQEDKIRWFRRWCATNGVQISEVLYEKVEEHARKHGYPDGHSQTNLEYMSKPKMVPLYKTCKKSMKEKSKGEFYCTKVNGWRAIMACDRCHDYREES